MAMEFKAHPDANYNPFVVTYYCYHAACPGRTKEKPWPKNDGEYKWTTVISRNGKPYRRKLWVCDHCGRVMDGTVSMYVFE